MTDDEALLAVAPELATVAPERREYFLTTLKDEVRESLGQYGLVLATAHELTLSNRGGSASAAGPILSESEGQLSRTYANAGGASDSYFAATTYGARYIAHVRRHTFGPRNRMVG